MTRKLPLSSRDVLTHLDWTPDIVLVSEHRAWLIDWVWRTLGAAWTYPASSKYSFYRQAGRHVRDRGYVASRVKSAASNS